MLVVAEGPEKGVKDKVGEIKDRFGIDLEFTALAVGPLLEKANQSLNADEGTFDIINVLGFSVSQMVGGDKFEQLNAYLDDPAKTPPDFDFADYPPGQTEYVGYFDVANGAFGGESLYLVPRPARRLGHHLLPQGPAGGGRPGAAVGSATPGSRPSRRSTRATSPATR